MKSNEVMGNSVEYTLRSILLKLFCFLLLPLYTRFIEPIDYGKAEIIIALGNIVNYSITFCLFSSIATLANIYDEDKEKVKRLFGSIFVFVTLIGTVLISLLIIFSESLGKIIFGDIEYYPTILIGLMGLLFACINLIYEYILQTKGKKKKIYICNIFNLIVLIFLNFIFIVILNMGLDGMLLAILLANIGLFVYILIDLIRHKWIKLCLDKNILKEALKSTTHYLIPNLSVTITSFVVRRFVMLGCGIGALGIIGVAARFGDVIDIIAYMVNGIFQLHLYNKYTSKLKNKKEINEYINMLVLIYGGLFFIIAMFSPEIVMLGLDEDYILAWTLIPYVAIIGIGKIVYYICIDTLIYENVSRKKLYTIVVFCCVLNGICSYVLISKIGIYGLYVGEIIQLVSSIVLCMILTRKLSNILLDREKLIGRSVLIVVFTVIGLVPTYVKFSDSVSKLNIIYKVMLCVLYVSITLYLLEKEVKKLLIYIKSKMLYKKMKKIHLKKGTTKKIIFISNLGNNYGGDPKVISELVHEECRRYEILWLFNNPREKKKVVPSYVKCIKWGTKKAYKELATAKVWVVDCNLGQGVYKGRTQVCINTLASDRHIDTIDNSLSDYSENDIWDLMLSGSKKGKDICRDVYEYKGEIYNFGCPRNDKLVNMKEDDVKNIKNKLGVEDNKILLYIIDNDSMDINDDILDVDKILDVLSKEYNCKWSAYLYVSGDNCRNEFIDKLKNNSNNVIDMSKYDDMSELLLVSDCLITDYSSYAGDYILTKKPVVIYRKYKEVAEHEEKFDIKQTPFMVGENTEEICEIIKYLNEDNARKNSLSIMRYYDTIETGFAGRKIVEYINRLGFEDSEIHHYKNE